MKDVHGGRPFKYRRPGPRALAAAALAAAMAGGPVLPGGLAVGAGALAAPALMAGLGQTPSGAPAGLTAAAGIGQVTLKWTAPASGTSFTIYEGTTPDVAHAAQAGTVTATGAVVTGLTGGVTYYFWVASAGETAVSNMATATPLGVPGAPTGLTATAGTARVSLSWGAATSTGGSPITRYNVYDGTTAGFTGSAAITSTTGTSITVAGLTSGTTYYFKVTAVNAVGEGIASAEASARVLAAGNGQQTQGPPTGLIATAGDTQVSLTWTAPASGGGSPVTGYRIYRATGPGAEDKTPVGSVKGTSVTVIGLANGTTYYFKVAAVNAAGKASPFSAEVSARPGKRVSAMVASLTAPTPPRQLIALLAAIGVTCTAGAIALTVWGRRQASRVPQRTGLHRRPR